MKTADFYDEQWNSAPGESSAQGEISPQRDIFSLAFTEAIAHSYSSLGNLKGKKLLEIGCGSGEQAVYFATHGTGVTVIDVSRESLRATERRAKARRVQLAVQQMNAEDLKFKDQEFDLVYINSVLMHVDTEKVMKECARVLKKGGRLVIIEPLQYAPFVQLYRLFGSYRKMKPRYATLKMFRDSKKYFTDFSHREFYLLAALFLPVFSVRSRRLQELYHYLARVDEKIMRFFPLLRKLCWVAVVEYET
ncbi:class I SAM-dependent methyltransferase [Candidatus Woesearchaeota archaeon]|nr:class I SAM-dependent methyltransferase [Candidatus Woesearchaeota archaeon]